MAESELYDALGVSRAATADEIRSAYRKLARELHPDLNPGDAAAEERFKKTAFAYDVLSDPDKRARYDEFGRPGLQPGFDPEKTRAYMRFQRDGARNPFAGNFPGGLGANFRIEDLFGDFAGFDRATRGGRRGGPRRGRDLETELEVDLLDAALGREVRFAAPGRAPLRVQLPPGAQEGIRIRLAGQGEAGSGRGSTGDLYLVLRIRPHPFFRRRGDDLELELPTTLPELILGAEVQVPTPDGVATLRIPPGSQPSQRLRMRSLGARQRDGRGRGHLLVRLSPVLPESGAELDAVARQLEALYAGRDVRAALRDPS